MLHLFSKLRGKLARIVVLGAAALAAAPAVAAADLQVSDYSWAPDPVPNGASAEFTIRLTNNGPDTVPDATVTIAVSDRFRVDAGDIPGFCSVSGAVGAQTVTCALSAFAPGDRTLTYAASAIAIGSSTTTASIASATIVDPNPANNSLSVAPAVLTGADMTVTKDDGLGGEAVGAGAIISYQLVATNGGPDATAAVRITDNLPPASDFDFQSATGTGWTCGRTGTTVTCNYNGSARCRR